MRAAATSNRWNWPPDCAPIAYSRLPVLVRRVPARPDKRLSQDALARTVRSNDCERAAVHDLER